MPHRDLGRYLYELNDGLSSLAMSIDRGAHIIRFDEMISNLYYVLDYIAPTLGIPDLEIVEEHLSTKQNFKPHTVRWRDLSASHRLEVASKINWFAETFDL